MQIENLSAKSFSKGVGQGLSPQGEGSRMVFAGTMTMPGGSTAAVEVTVAVANSTILDELAEEYGGQFSLMLESEV